MILFICVLQNGGILCYVVLNNSTYESCDREIVSRKRLCVSV